MEEVEVRIQHSQLVPILESRGIEHSYNSRGGLEVRFPKGSWLIFRSGADIQVMADGEIRLLEGISYLDGLKDRLGAPVPEAFQELYELLEEVLPSEKKVGFRQ